MLVKISIFFSKISKNIDLGQIIEKFRFWSKFTKHIILVENLENFVSVEFSVIFEKFQF